MDAKNWILLRGLARGRGHWGRFAALLEQAFPADHFEWLDLPGNGERCTEQSPWEIADYVKDLRQHSQFIQEGRSCQILALSLGGMIAIEWMKSYPHEVSKAFVVCTSSSGFSPVPERFLPLNYLKAFKMFLSDDVESKERIILEMISNNKDRRDEELEGMKHYSEKYPVKEGNILRQMWAASRYRFPSLAPGDVRLIGASGDRLVSPQCTLDIAQRWGVEAKMHPWAGHDIAIDDPHWLIEQLL